MDFLGSELDHGIHFAIEITLKITIISIIYLNDIFIGTLWTVMDINMDITIYLYITIYRYISNLI